MSIRIVHHSVVVVLECSECSKSWSHNLSVESVGEAEIELEDEECPYCTEEEDRDQKIVQETP